MSRPFRMLVWREVMRWWKVPTQVLASPTISATLYLAVFGISLGNAMGHYAGHSYLAFLVPGLVMMQVINSSFANSSSSLLISKYQGNLVDILLAPLSASEFVLGYAIGAVLRALVVAVCATLVGALFSHSGIAHPLLALLVIAMAALFFSLLGVVAGIAANTFDGLSVFTTFLILPLTYLGGVFYSVERLPPLLATLSRFNPLLYLIDGLRFTYLGVSDVPFWKTLLILAVFNLAAFLIPARLVASGYRLRE